MKNKINRDEDEQGISWNELVQELQRIEGNWPSDIKNNRAAYLAKRNEVWELLLRHYVYRRDKGVKKLANGTYSGQGVNADAVDTFVNNTLGKFDPSMGSLGNFISKYMKGYIQNAERDSQKVPGAYTKKDSKTGERKLPPIPIGGSKDEDSTAPEDKLKDSDQDPYENLKQKEMLQSYFVSVVAMVINYWSLPGIRHAQSSLDYYRMWCAERVVNALQICGAKLASENEEDLFRAMDLNYLDFFMEACVRTTEELARTPLKPEKAFNSKGSEHEIPWKLASYHGNNLPKLEWLIPEVPMKYKGLKSRSLISERRKKYTETFYSVFLNPLKREYEN